MDVQLERLRYHTVQTRTCWPNATDLGSVSVGTVSGEASVEALDVRAEIGGIVTNCAELLEAACACTEREGHRKRAPKIAKFVLRTSSSNQVEFKEEPCCNAELPQNSPHPEAMAYRDIGLGQPWASRLRLSPAHGALKKSPQKRLWLLFRLVRDNPSACFARVLLPQSFVSAPIRGFHANLFSSNR
jgi:hypothetical protein